MIRSKALLLSAALCLGGSQAYAFTFSVSDATQGYFDASSGTRSFAVSQAQAGGVITKVTLSLTFGKHDGQNFGINEGGVPFLNEIEFILTGSFSSGNSTALLISAGSFNEGSTGFLNRTVVFDDTASTVVNVDPNQIFAGTFRSTGAASAQGLNQFNQRTLEAGVWTLSIRDTVFGDGLDYNSATLTITTGDDGVGRGVPDSGATIALLSVALAGLAAFRRTFTR